MADKTEWDLIPRNAAWQCADCKKQIRYTITCKVYSKEIPDEILAGEKICEDREPLDRR